MNLLFIHGRSQQGKDPVELQAQWEDALRKGLNNAGLERPANVQITFPFYADDLDQLVEKVNASLMTDVVARGGAVTDADEMAFRFEVYSELAAGANISDAEIQANLEPGPQERGPQNWKWVHAILRALDRTDFGEDAIDRFTRDVYVYLTVPAVRRAIDKIVANKLAAGQWVVVAHSLGTVVGYNVLRAVTKQQGIEVTRYITVGSPLGIRAIRERLDTPLAMPACTKGWYNAYDTRDVVSLYPLDIHNFNVTPSIENNGTVDNFTENRHGIVGYLDDANVARKIVDSLAG